MRSLESPSETSADPWTVLGLPLGADDVAVRTAYRTALRAAPPETDPAGFKRVRAAYEALREPAQRTQTALLERWLMPDLPPLELGDLGLRPVAAPQVSDLLEDLRRILLAGTELGRTDFSADLRPIPGDGPTPGEG